MSKIENKSQGTKETVEEKKKRQYRKMAIQLSETAQMAASYQGEPEGYPPLYPIAKVIKRKRKNTPKPILKEARDRHIAKMLGENPELTCEEIATKLKCNKSTIARSEAWKNRGVLQYQPPKGYMKSSKDNDTYEVDGFAGS